MNFWKLKVVPFKKRKQGGIKKKVIEYTEKGKKALCKIRVS